VWSLGLDKNEYNHFTSAFKKSGNSQHVEEVTVCQTCDLTIKDNSESATTQFECFEKSAGLTSRIFLPPSVETR
jgi:hypothetical protein